jgi:hypothetical protein
MRFARVLLLALFLTGPANAQEPAPASRLYAALGLGFVNLKEKGLGIDLPLGLQVVLPRHRLVASIQLLDLALLQQQERTNRRFVRTFNAYGEPLCYDNQTGFLVSSFRCGGDTELFFSAGLDLSVTPVETSFFGGKPGKLALGLGLRGFEPRTVYGTLGLLFNGPNGVGNSVRVALGRHYVFVGVHWALPPRRLLGKR